MSRVTVESRCKAGCSWITIQSVELLLFFAVARVPFTQAEGGDAFCDGAIQPGKVESASAQDKRVRRIDSMDSSWNVGSNPPLAGLDGSLHP